MHHTSVPGWFSCMVLATEYIVASSTPQASSTLSGDHLARMSTLTSSMP